MHIEPFQRYCDNQNTYKTKKDKWADFVFRANRNACELTKKWGQFVFLWRRSKTVLNRYRIVLVETKYIAE